MHFLIDADSIIYKAGCANETRSYLISDAETGDLLHQVQYKKEALEWCGEDLDLYTIEHHKEAGELSHALANAKTIMESIVSHEACTTYETFIGGKGNFRYMLYDKYKSNRNPNDKPIQEAEIREYLQRRWGAVVIDGIEVDDEISILAYTSPATTAEETPVIVSIDKDLDNTPGWHYNYDKRELYLVEAYEADYNFYKQMLTGDTTDAIPGVKGYGPKKAEKALEGVPHSELCNVVWEIYQQQDLSYDFFVMNGQLLWMMRERDKLWQPEM